MSCGVCAQGGTDANGNWGCVRADYNNSSNGRSSPTSCDNTSIRQAGQYDPNTVNQPQCTDADGDGWCAGDDCDDGNQFVQTGCPARCVRQTCPAGWSWWWELCACRFGRCPVLIDTAGDKHRLTDAARGVPFDLDGDGQRERVAWTEADSDDAWLALDRDGNGRVDSGAELFGNFTEQPPSSIPNGFNALAEFDEAERGGNSDGRIDARDSVFPALRLWRDVNHNGISEPDELSNLPALGVRVLELDYRQSKKVDRHGNEFRYRAKVRDARGAQTGRWAWDVFLVY